jgi:hypothetical protein
VRETLRNRRCGAGSFVSAADSFFFVKNMISFILDNYADIYGRKKGGVSG